VRTWQKLLFDLDDNMFRICVSRWLRLTGKKHNNVPQPGDLLSLVPSDDMLPGEVRAWATNLLGTQNSQHNPIRTEADWLTLIRRYEAAGRMPVVPPTNVQRAVWRVLQSLGGHQGWAAMKDDHFSHRKFETAYVESLKRLETKEEVAGIAGRPLPDADRLLAQHAQRLTDDDDE
jgi:hypothetical protein